MNGKKHKRKNQNRRIKKRKAVIKDRQMVRGSLTFLGFFVVFGCLGLVTWVAGKMADPATLPIKSVKVEGQFKYLSTAMLEKLVADKVDGGFFTLDVERIRKSVLSAPWVREATVRKLWPNTLYVKIKEQNAVVRWGNTGFLNHKGELFEPEDTTRPDITVTLHGPAGTEQLVFEKYKKLMGMLNPHHRTIASVELNDRRSWSFEIKNGPDVILGRKEVDQRLWKYVKNVEEIFGRDLHNIAQVDLRYTNGFTVRENTSKEALKDLKNVSDGDSRGT